MTIESKLILPKGEVVAIVEPELASALYHATTHTIDKPATKSSGSGTSNTSSPRRESYSENNIKTGNTYIGLYGAIGVVEITRPYTSVVSLVGTVHIPKQTFPLVELIKGAQDTEQFYHDFFRHTDDSEWKDKHWNIRDHHSTIDREQVDAAFIHDRGYHWKIEKVANDIFKDKRPFEQQLKEYEQAVKQFITRLDHYVHMLNPRNDPITPEYAQLRFTKLQIGNMPMIEKL